MEISPEQRKEYRALYRECGTIDAIKRYREHTGCTLKQAKDAIEGMVTEEDKAEQRRRADIASAAERGKWRGNALALVFSQISDEELLEECQRRGLK